MSLLSSQSPTKLPTCAPQPTPTTGTLAIVAMSIGNPQFSDSQKLHQLLSYVRGSYPNFVIYVTQENARHNYSARGYACDEALAKARKYGLAMRRKIEALPNDIGESRHSNRYVDFRNQVMPHTAYQTELRRLVALERTSECFKADLLSTSAGSIEKQLTPGLPSAAIARAVRRASYYLLEELAFTLSAPAIFRYQHAAFVYHREFPILRRVLDGAYDGVASASVMFDMNPGASKHSWTTSQST